MTTKYLFFTGGVVSSVGKGVTAAAMGLLLKERGFNVAVQKLDPYINVDPARCHLTNMVKYTCWMMARKPILT